MRSDDFFGQPAALDDEFKDGLKEFIPFVIDQCPWPEYGLEPNGGSSKAIKLIQEDPYLCTRM